MFYLGFDIGGTKCAAILACSDGMNIPEILYREQFATGDYSTPQRTIDELCNLGMSILEKADLKTTDLTAIGISCGGPLDSRNGLILSPPNLVGWDRIPIVTMIEKRFHVPTKLQNDANAGALAEWKFGAGRGFRNLVFITFGTGCGAGLILDGKLYSGTNGNAGECGHIRLSKFGPVGYGKSGSMEGFCSGNGIAQLGSSFIYEMIQNGEHSELCDLYQNGQIITAKLLAEYARKDDKAAVKAFSVSASMLGYGLSILIDILNPDLIVIGGVFSRCMDLLLKRCEQVIDGEALSSSRNRCKIVPTGLGEQIGDYASIAVAFYTEHL